MKRKVSRKEVNKQVLKEYKVSKNIRLIDFLFETFPDKSRNNIKSLLSRKLVLIDGAPISQFDFELVKGDIVQISPVSVAKTKQQASKIKIIFEDDDLLVINKPAGLLSIATDKEKTTTAYRLCTDYIRSKDSHARIFVTHRLDKETSGVLLFSKNEKIRNSLQDKWNEIVLEREYIALCEGVFEKKQDRIISWLLETSTNLMYSSHKKGDGQKAITNYKVINENNEYSLLQVNIDSGRKNQIRVHMKDLGHNIVGDDKYGSLKDPIGRLGLHARKLVLKDPRNDKILTFTATGEDALKRVFEPGFVPVKSKKVIEEEKKAKAKLKNKRKK